MISYPKFSLITICYNSEKTIERTIESILHQIYDNYEYIIVDGASSDNTVEVIKKYEPLFEGRLHWVSERDKGIYNAMNKGIALCTGVIIGIVNSDDWLEGHALQTVQSYYIMNQEPETKIYCGSICFHFNDGTIKELKTDLKLFKKYASLYEMAGIRHPAVFVPYDLYKHYGTFDERLMVMADCDLILRFYFNDVDFIPINKVLSNMSDGGLSNSRVLKKRYKDKCIILKKYNVPLFKRLYILTEWLIRQGGKELLPYGLLKKIRR